MRKIIPMVLVSVFFGLTIPVARADVDGPKLILRSLIETPCHR